MEEKGAGNVNWRACARTFYTPYSGADLVIFRLFSVLLNVLHAVVESRKQMLFLLCSRNTVRAKASLVQREVAKPEVLPEGLYSKRYCFFSGLPVKMQNLIVSNPSVSVADSSLYTREPLTLQN